MSFFLCRYIYVFVFRPVFMIYKKLKCFYSFKYNIANIQINKYSIKFQHEHEHEHEQ